MSTVNNQRKLLYWVIVPNYADHFKVLGVKKIKIVNLTVLVSERKNDKNFFTYSMSLMNRLKRFGEIFRFRDEIRKKTRVNCVDPFWRSRRLR